MKGNAALVTGAASGIGRDLALALAQRGVAVTVADIDAAGAEAVAQEITRQGGAALAVRCDVADVREQRDAFQQHCRRFNRLDYALLNAGIGEQGDMVFGKDGAWQATLDVDLRGVIQGVGLAARAMLTGDPDGNGGGSGGSSKGGVIMITASAGGVYPMPLSPVYAAAKAGCVQLTRSLAPRLIKKGFTDTALVRGMQQDAALAAEVMRDTQGRLLSVDKVTQAGLALLADGSKVGTCLVVLVDGNWVEPQRTRFKSGEPAVRAVVVVVEMPSSAAAARVDPALRAWATAGGAAPGLPTAATRVVEVYRLSSDFRAATRIVRRPLPAQLPPGAVLVRRLYAGINASDVNFSAGRYFGSTAAAEKKLPFEAGFEAVGVVAAAAPDVQGIAVGQPVCTMTYGGFAEWAVVGARHVFPVPEASPEMAALMTSGLTASIALEQAGGLRKAQTVLVTAAAGGTGQIAVQLAVMAGCHVIGTCSGGDKEVLLRSLGCHRVVNYRLGGGLKEVLKREYPQGVDLVWESVGGEMFDACVDALAPRGRLLTIGHMSQYADGWAKRPYPGLAEKLLWKSATLQGFFLLHYASHWRRHLKKLAGLFQGGQLRVQMDPKRFIGLEAVPDAVEWLQTGRSVGKVYVQIAPQLPTAAARPRL
ncbi:hypothetical protein CHLNCDRAFT_134990 [Chlorella variabilis]|uniref:Enoyl reductase (ER) domain-containing protein n=1 Tax=Chlorella variabilis TaxID=554065 RepID=E1ZHA7_CHLVA|nr:hypothetical protein CHLNCDRAFT_134990 [Chlorella variabilis]EFN55092.1 hypothetical protein CHLNCDRAFT_134990 [Chlorella variabilis]|eukprot:XP_005847194.1 hypothetical protein CHLNCDRAFT_134990 [Chlorella variabilis]